MEFIRELSWQCYNKHQLSAGNMDDILMYKYGVEMQPKPDETPLVYFATPTRRSRGFDCDRDEFRQLPQQRKKIRRRWSADAAATPVWPAGTPAFALEIPVSLRAGEEREINIFLGTGMTKADIARSVAHCRERGFAEASFKALGGTVGRLFLRLLFACEVPG